jgi:stage V sporulation protein B
MKDMTPTAVSNVIEGIIKLIFGLGFAIYLPKHFDVNPAEGAVIGIAVSCFAGMLYLWILYIFSHKETCENKKTKHITKKLIAIALPISLTILVTNMTSLIDLFTIIRGLPGDENPDFLYGCYTGLAVTLFNLVPTITNMFGKSAFPHIAEAIKCRSNAKKHIEDLLLSTSFIAIPCGTFLYLLSSPILRFLFHSRAVEVSASEQSLAYLGLSVVFVSLCYPLFLILQAADKAFLTTEIMFAGVVIKFALNVVLIKQMGITGAAISTLVTYLVMCLLSYAALRRHIGMSLNLRRIFFAPMYAGVLCAVTVILCKSVMGRFFVFGDSVWDMFLILAGCGFAGGGMYLFAMYLLSVTPTPRPRVAQLTHSRPRVH